MSVETNWSGQTYTIIHNELAWHFRRAYGKSLKLEVIDVLDSDESIPGQLAPRIPSMVRRELRQQGYQVIR